MLATLAGFLALLLGLSLLLLPLLVTELSRPRDSAWGAVVLLLGLVLVTSAERLTGSPMLAVLCGGLLVGRLGSEVAQSRWRALSDEERLALRSAERWSRSLNQLTAAAASLLQSAFAVTAAGSTWLAERRQGRSHGKRWVRAETPETPVATTGSSAPEPADPSPSGQSEGELPRPEPHQPQELSTPPAAMPASADLSEAQPAAAAADQRDQGTRQDPAAEALPSPDRNAAVEAGPGRLEADAPACVDPGVRVVADFAGVDALLATARAPDGSSPGASPVAAAEPAEPSQG